MTRLRNRLLAAAVGLGAFLAAPLAQAGSVYPLWKEAIIQASTNSSLGGTVKCQIASATYTYSASHQFLSDLSGLLNSAQTLASKTYVSGKFTSASVTFTAVTTGSTATQFICWVDTGSSATSRLVVQLNGFSVPTNGGDIVLSPDGTLGWFTM